MQLLDPCVQVLDGLVFLGYYLFEVGVLASKSIDHRPLLFDLNQDGGLVEGERLTFLRRVICAMRSEASLIGTGGKFLAAVIRVDF